MNNQLPFLAYTAFLLICLVVDVVLYVNFRKSSKKLNTPLMRLAMIASFIIAGLVVSVARLLPPVYALTPGIAAAAILYYVMFIKYRGRE